MSDVSPVESVRGQAVNAKRASRELARASRGQKDQALYAIARRLRADGAQLLDANRDDVARFREKEGATPAFIDRLTLTESRIEAVAQAVENIAGQDDPVGAVIGMIAGPTVSLVGQVRIPLGVIGIIYEARPNVTVDAAALCIKSGNAVLLRGGSEAAKSNAALGRLLQAGLDEAGLPADAVQIVPPAIAKRCAPCWASRASSIWSSRGEARGSCASSPSTRGCP